MKEYKCVQVGHHKKISEVADKHLRSGWALHTYQAAGGPNNVVHYFSSSGNPSRRPLFFDTTRRWNTYQMIHASL